ncbi:hypothetical protein NDU88_000419 [Pleurodeles waltl]|uniref:Uncharacterized protein n=1 Tax=Pleurodeles waltl TaxID=8319 RepID=A0AAV7VYD0_PLEWA|nr:hypothetical protein NDU88_000419 [Pleurodeles waltl]
MMMYEQVKEIRKEEEQRKQPEISHYENKTLARVLIEIANASKLQADKLDTKIDVLQACTNFTTMVATKLEHLNQHIKQAQSFTKDKPVWCQCDAIVDKIPKLPEVMSTFIQYLRNEAQLNFKNKREGLSKALENNKPAQEVRMKTTNLESEGCDRDPYDSQNLKQPKKTKGKSSQKEKSEATKTLTITSPEAGEGSTNVPVASEADTTSEITLVT